MAVLTILNRGPEYVKAVIFGTGASERDGLKEAEYMKQFLLKALEHQDRLQHFEVLKNHPRFQSTRDIVTMSTLLCSIICEMDSQNTVEEIRNAARIFVNYGVREVIHVTCASHAPRCIRDAAIAQEKGLIPQEQLWSVVRDHMTYAHTSASDVVVIEPPHRGDDPMLKEEIQPHQVFPRFYSIFGVDKKVAVLKRVREVFDEAL